MDSTTNTGYHILLLDLHVDDENQPVATTCGPPKGSPHYNLHFDRCKNVKCNGCSFPFETYSQYETLEARYLVPIHNWHAFVYHEVVGQTAYVCVCLYDSTTHEAKSECFTNDIKRSLLDAQAEMQEVAMEVWVELDDLPWTSKTAIILVVIAALLALFPEIIAALITAGIALTTEVIAAATAALSAGLASSFGIVL